MDALFRQEAIEHRNRTWIGEVQAIRPLSLRVLTLLVVVVLAATAAFLALAQYTHKARIAGVLLPDRGVIRLMPPAVGTVVERRAVHRDVAPDAGQPPLPVARPREEVAVVVEPCAGTIGPCTPLRRAEGVRLARGCFATGTVHVAHRN